MQAVYPSLRGSQDAFELTALFNRYRVGGVAAWVCWIVAMLKRPCALVQDIFVNGASQGNIDYLQSSANAQERDLLINRCLSQGYLELISFLVNPVQ